MSYYIEVTAPLGLNYRSQPSTSSTKKGAYSRGTKLMCNTKTKTGDQTWYQIESSKYWVCGYMPNEGWFIKGLDTPKPSTTDTTTKPPKYDKPVNSNNKFLQDALEKENQKNDFEFGSSKTIGMPNDSKGSTNALDFGNIPSHPQEQTNFRIDTSWLNEYINTVKRNHNIYVEGDKSNISSYFTEFNRFGITSPDMELDKTFGYVFITRPDLNLLDGSAKNAPLNKQVKNDAMCYYLNKTRPDILRSLTKNLSSNHDFNTFLCNHAASFEVSDEYIKTGEMGETFTGYKISFGKSNIDSKTAGSFSIRYIDDKELNIYKVHKLWIEYISNVYRGEWSPKREYMAEKILDYAVSVYYVLCAADGETVLFWSKYYGVFPTNTPSSNLSWVKGSILNNPEYSITYQYSFKEDFNPLSLAEFNMNSHGGDFVYKNIYEPVLNSTGRSLSGSPFIDTVNVNGNYRYKLRFRRE